jgi:hypothetical protein
MHCTCIFAFLSQCMAHVSLSSVPMHGTCLFAFLSQCMGPEHVYLPSCPNARYMYTVFAFLSQCMVQYLTIFAFLSQCMAHLSLLSCPNAWYMYICRPVQMHDTFIFSFHGPMQDTYIYLPSWPNACRLYCIFACHGTNAWHLFICLPVPLDACRMYIDLPVLSIQSNYGTWNFLDILSSGMTIFSMLNDLPVSCRLLFNLHIFPCVLIPLRTMFKGINYVVSYFMKSSLDTGQLNGTGTR